MNMTNATHEVENFYGCYLLYCTNPKFKGRTYIGKTTDPNRRIWQHNKGKQVGGAWKTHNKGPWEMILIVHGFPNEISALRFEWAWQNPEKSRRLRHIKQKTKSEQGYKYKFRVMSEMLCTQPWNRLALTIRWLKQDYKLDFSPDLTPPLHMAIAYGPVISVKQKSRKNTEQDKVNNEEDLVSIQSTGRNRCDICLKRMEAAESVLRCYHPHCSMSSHMLCLANKLLEKDPLELVPVEGICPKCHRNILWGDLIRFAKGCYQEQVAESESCDDVNHWANQLTQL